MGSSRCRCSTVLLCSCSLSFPFSTWERKTDLTLNKTSKTDFPVKRAGTHHRFAAHFAEGTGTFGLGAGPDVLVELKVERTKTGLLKYYCLDRVGTSSKQSAARTFSLGIFFFPQSLQGKGNFKQMSSWA